MAHGYLCQTTISQRASIAIATGKGSASASATAAPGRCAIAGAVYEDDGSTWRETFETILPRKLVRWLNSRQTDNKA